MKAAMGEVNLTVIAVIAIALVAAVGIPLVTNLLNNMGDTTCDGIGQEYNPETKQCE